MQSFFCNEAKKNKKMQELVANNPVAWINVDNKLIQVGGE